MTRKAWSRLRAIFPGTALYEMFGLDVRSMALFRVAIAVVMLGDLAIRSTDLTFFYTDAGVYPRSAMLVSPTLIRFWSPYLLNGSTLFAGVLFALTALCAIGLLVGYHTRLMTCLCWYLMSSLQSRNFLIGQGGDEYLRLVLFWGMFLPLGARMSLDHARQATADPGAERVLSIGSVGMTLQTVILYWMTAILKSQGHSWWDGRAIEMVLHLDLFAKAPAFYLLLFPGLLKWLSWWVFGLEALGPFLLLTPIWNGPLRTFGVVAFILLHLGILMTLALGPFQWVSMAAILIFLPSWFWDRTGKTPASLAHSHREPLWSETVAGICLLAVLVWCASLLWPRSIRLPPVVEQFCYRVNLKQRWGMFSPEVPSLSGWVVLAGQLRHGDRVDFLRGGTPVRWSAPVLTSASFKNERWRKYLMNMSSRATAPHRRPLVDYYCRTWNAEHSGDEGMTGLQLIRVQRDYSKSNEASGYTREILWGESCSNS